ncbi:hypothetical protein Gotur_033468 [Gossypium turneri]
MLFRLEILVQSLVNPSSKSCLVSGRGWDWNFLNFFVDNSILSYIVAVPPPTSSIGNDELISRWLDHGPQRVRHFLWLVLNEKLMTNVERCRRGFIDDPSCASCGHVEESIIHVLRDYASAQEVWRQLVLTEDDGSLSLELFPEIYGSRGTYGCFKGITKQRRDQVWNPPPLRFIKLNTDRARDPVLKEASTTAMARDDLDCAQAIEAILDRSYGKLYRDLTSRIQELCKRQWRVIIKKIPREANVIAHLSAGKMKAFPYALIIF